jgi:hemerythrin-like domain-containing protein
VSDVFELLERDHEEVRHMMSELERGPTAATGADETQLAARKKLAEHLVIEESKHEAVEQEYFWPAVREHVRGGDRLADTGIDQEQRAKKLLDRLDRYGAPDDEFEKLLATFIADAREHIAFEETRVWPELRKTISAAHARELGAKLEQAKKLAPTRPHPGTPPRPGVLKATAPAVAMADRLRDAISGRGRA